jgi:adenylate kinase
MTGTSVALSPLATTHLRLVLLGANGALSRRVIDPVCSLHHCENVSADALLSQEIDGRTALGSAAARARAAGRPVTDETMLAVMRRWFWSRKNGRGFVLSGFPASVVQAMVFDQWLDERDDSLTACLWLDETGTSTAANEVGENRVAAYYRERGLLFHIAAKDTSSSDVALAGVLDLVRGLVADR